MKKKELVKLLAKTNKDNFNESKLLEELIELSEVLIKRKNKTAEYAPKLYKVIEEIGDVQIRLSVLIEQLNLKESIKERITLKSIELKGYYDSNKYTGGV